MKKLLLILSLIILTTPCYAQEEVKDPDVTLEIGTPKEETVVDISEQTPVGGIWSRIPELQNVGLFSLRNHTFEYAAMFNLVEWKNASLALGYSPSDTFVAGISYDLTSLERWGVKTPILKDLKIAPMAWYSLSRINAQDISNAREDFGIGFSLLAIKF